MALTACQSSVLDPQGAIGAAEKTILIDSLVIMFAIVVPTMAATLIVAWWFRASNRRARHRPNWSFSGRIELVVWGIPALVIILLGGVTWIGAHALDPAKPLVSTTPALDIDVVSMDWKWLFIYRDAHIASVNRLVVPAGVPLHFSLTSASVMNTFFIPQLGGMIYTMNGMTTELNLQADRPEVLRGISGHFSGEGFSDMHFEVRVVPAPDFAAWSAGVERSGTPLDVNAYNSLAAPSVAVAPVLYRLTEPDLFQKIVTRQVASGSGPATDAAGAEQEPLKEH